MSLPVKSFDQLVNDQVTAAQAFANGVDDFSSGTIELALIQANADMGVWLEYIANYVLSLTRFATSSGVELDTAYAQFQYRRLPALAASGDILFSRMTANQAVQINVDATLKTLNNLQTFTVIEDTTNTFWSPLANAYIIPIGITSALIPARAVVPGADGNVLPNTITVIASPISGIDTVTNPLSFAGGRAAESDDNFRARFPLYISYLARGTPQAAQYVGASTPGVARFRFYENQTFAGAVQHGFFYLVIDDGSGNAPSTLIDAVQAAVTATVRPLAVYESVYSASPILMNISVDVALSSTGFQSTALTAIQTAINNYLAPPFQIDQGVPYSRVYQVIYDAYSQITDVTNLVLNGGTSDLPAVLNEVYVPGTLTVNFI